MARIMMVRLLEVVAEEVLLETNCGFMRAGPTCYLLQNSCREQHRDLIMDLKKGFDTSIDPFCGVFSGNLSARHNFWAFSEHCTMAPELGSSTLVDNPKVFLFWWA
jgi:hypothetical protein